MNPELARMIDRIQRSRAAGTARERAGAGSGEPAPAPTTSALPIGARVFDRVTGLEGEVVYGTRQNIVYQTPER